MHLHFGVGELLGQDGLRGFDVHFRGDLAVDVGEANHLAKPLLWDGGLVVVGAGDGQRAVHGGAHGAVHGGAHHSVVDGGRHGGRLDIDAVRVEPAGGGLLAQQVALHLLAVDRLGGLGLAGFDADGAVGGVEVQFVADAVEGAVQGGVVDTRNRVDLVGGEQAAQARDRVGGFDAGGVHGGLVVDVQAGLRRHESGGLVAGADLDGLVSSAAEFALELGARLVGFHRTDIHAADGGAARDVAAVHRQIRQVHSKRDGEDAEQHTERDLAAASLAARLVRGCLHRSHPNKGNADV